MDTLLAQRSEARVMDVLDLKIKYARREEKDAKLEYREMKSRVSKEFQQSEGRKRKFKRIIERIARDTQYKWEKSIRRQRG